MKKLIKIFILINALFFINTNTIYTFDTIKEINQYAQNKDEFPKIDNNNYLYPEYTSTLKKEVPTWASNLIENVLDFLKIKKRPWWIEAFTDELKVINKKRVDSKLENICAIKITPKEKTDFIIFGDLNGNIHSLNRDLMQLKDSKYLDESLKLTRENIFIIFNGNVLGRSPHILETFNVILNLMQKNPNQVFFLKGQHEINQNWKNFGLKEELQAKAYRLSDKTIPLEKEINTFIKTLPSVIYINYSNENYIRISNFDRNYPKFLEQYFYNFLNKTTNKTIELFDCSDKKLSDETFNIEIQAIIKGKDRTFHYEKTDGLSYLYPDKGAIAWSVFSSPSLPNQRLYNFFNDAFAILTITPKKDPVIKLYKQNINLKKGFKTKTYNLLTKELLKKERLTQSQKSEIIIGTSIDLTGDEKEIGRAIYQGLSARIEEENRKGGIHGQKIKLIAKDDQFNVEKYQQNLNLLLNKYKTNITVGNVGSSNLKEALPLINKEDIGIFFPYTGSPEFRKANLTNIINLKTSYETETKTLIKYLLKNFNKDKDKIVIFYQDDLYGQNFNQSAINFLKTLKIKNYLSLSHKMDYSNVRTISRKIIQFNPQNILLFSVEKPSQMLINDLGAKFLMNKNLFTNSILAESRFQKFIKDKGLKITTSQATPNITTSNLEIVKEYKKAISNAKYPESSISLEGYIYASILIDAMNKIEGKITKQKIMQQLEQIKNHNFKGINLNFDPKTRQLANLIWLKTENGKTISYNKPPKTSKQKELVIGTTMDLSAEFLDIGNALLEGLRLRLEEENNKGGINGTKIKLVHLDDKYQPNIAKQNIKSLMDKKIDIILNPTGSYTLSSFFDLVKNEKILVMFPRAVSPIFRKPEYKNVIHFLPSSEKEGSVITEYLIKNLDIKNTALLYQLEPYSEGAFTGATKVLNKYDLKENENWIQTSHIPNTLNIQKSVEAIKNFNPYSLILLSATNPIKSLLKKLTAAFLFDKTLVGISSCASTKLKTFLKKRNLKISHTQAVPGFKSRMEVVKKYMKQAKIHNKKPKLFGLEGYITASLFIYILNKIEGKITKEKIIKTVEQIKNENCEGFPLNFNPQTRQLADEVWINDKENKVTRAQDLNIQSSSTPTTPTPQKIKSIKSRNTVKIGSILDLSAELSTIGSELLQGLNLAIKNENQLGGINGKKIQLTAFDTAYNNDIALKRLLELEKKDIKTLLSPTGSYQVNYLLPFINKYNFSVIFPDANAPIFNKEDKKNFINIIPSSKMDGQAISSYILKKYNFNKIAIFYQKEPFSEGTFLGAKEVLEKHNLTEGRNWIAVSHQPNTLKITSAARKIKEFNPEAIFLFSMDRPTRALIKKIGNMFLFNKQLIGNYSLGTETFQKFIKNENLKCIYSQYVPNQLDTSLEIVNELHNIVGNKKNLLTPIVLQSFIAGKLFVHIAKQIEGEITGQKLIEKMEKIKNLDFKGIKFNFNPKTRNLVTTMWINIGKGKYISRPINQISENQDITIQKNKIAASKKAMPKKEKSITKEEKNINILEKDSEGKTKKKEKDIKQQTTEILSPQKSGMVLM